MSESTPACPKCGGTIPPEAPQGLCPKCLLAQASFPTETGPGTRHSRPLPPGRDELAAAFPHLEILELIGQGGMGFVYKARQAKLDRLVALKILAQPLAEQTMFAERFTREGRTLAKLNHPNIVTIHDFGQAGPFFYLLMEFVDGVNLRQAMRAGAVTAEQALAIVPKICEALQYAHNEGVLHRDIKPDNILLDTRGRVKIADFGIAKLMAEAVAESPLTGSGASLGTPHYMAPEQIERPNAVDHRADIFSLGVVFYEMLTGELPLGRFAAPSHARGVDPRLDDVVLRTLEKQPDRRPQSADEVRTQVENIATKSGPTRQTKPAPALNFTRLLAMALILGMAGVGGAILTYYLGRKPAPEPEATLLPTPEPGRKIAGGKELTLTEANREGPLVTAKTKIRLARGETLIPVVRYGNGAFGPADVTFYNTTRRRPEGPESDEITFMWALPNSSNEQNFEVAAALQRLNQNWVRKPFTIGPNSTLELFGSTNAQGQAFAAGLYYRKDTERLLSIPAFATATLTNLQISYVETSSIIGGSFDAAVPYGYRAVPTLKFADSSEGSTETTAQSSSQYVQAHWNLSGISVKDPDALKEELRQIGGSIQLTPGSPFRVFTIRDGLRTAKGYLELQPTWIEPEKGQVAPKLVDFIWGNFTKGDQRIFTLRTETGIFPGEKLEALIRYQDGPWEQPQVVRTQNRIIRGPIDASNTTDFVWTVPDSFTSEFEASPAWRRFAANYLQKPLPLFPDEVVPVFTMTNGARQIVSCGLRYSKTNAPTADRQTKARVIGLKVKSPRIRNIIEVSYSSEVPNGFRVEGSASVDGRETRSETWNHLGSPSAVSVNIPSDFPDYHPSTTFSNITELSMDAPIELVALTNKLGQVLQVMLNLVDATPKIVEFSRTRERTPGDRQIEYQRVNERLRAYYKKEADLLQIYTPGATLVKEHRASINQLEAEKKKLEGEFPDIFMTEAIADLAPNENLELVMINSSGEVEPLSKTWSFEQRPGQSQTRMGFRWQLPGDFSGVTSSSLADEIRSIIIRRNQSLPNGANFLLARLEMGPNGPERYLAAHFSRRPAGQANAVANIEMKGRVTKLESRLAGMNTDQYFIYFDGDIPRGFRLEPNAHPLGGAIGTTGIEMPGVAQAGPNLYSSPHNLQTRYYAMWQLPRGFSIVGKAAEAIPRRVDPKDDSIPTEKIRIPAGEEKEIFACTNLAGKTFKAVLKLAR